MRVYSLSLTNVGPFDEVRAALRSMNVGKPANTAIPVAGCVDPCAPGVRPGNDLVFDKEFVVARDASPRGDATIRKCRLDREDLNRARVRALRDFIEAVIEIERGVRASGRAEMNDDERALLRAYADRRRPFSRMMAAYVGRVLR